MKFNISFGPCTLSFGETFIVVSLATPGCLASPEMKPALHKGMWAEHLSIPLKPMARGKDAGKYNIHLTYPDGAHIPVALVDPEDSKRVGKAIEASTAAMIRETLVGKIHRVDSDWLSARGYEVVFFDPDEFPERLVGRFQQSRRHFRVSEERLEGLVEDALIADPAIIDDADFKMAELASVQAVRLDGGAPSLHLQYDSKGLWGSSPAWYVWPQDRFRYQAEQLMVILNRHIGASLWRSIRIICTEMGIPIDFERLDNIISDPQAPIIEQEFGAGDEEVRHAQI